MLTKVKKQDTVLVLSGKDKGKKGKVISVFPRENKAIVENVNVVKRHTRRTAKSQGGIIEKPVPIYLSKLMLICPKCNQPTRPKSEELALGQCGRSCRKCGQVIDKV